MRKKELRKLVEATWGERKGKKEPQIIAYLRKCVVDKELYADRVEIEGVRLMVAQLKLRDMRGEKDGSATVSVSDVAERVWWAKKGEQLLCRSDLTPEQRHRIELTNKVNVGTATQAEIEEFMTLVRELEKINKATDPADNG